MAGAGTVLSRYVQAGGILEIALRLTGHASDPNVELDPQAMEESSRSVLEQAAEEAVRSGEADLRERGRDLLRGLTGAGPTETPDSTSSPADTTGGGGGG